MSTLPEQNGQPTRVSRRKKALLTIYEIAVFGMLGALMMVSDLLMNIIPNVHLVGVMIVVLTVLYRWKALFPIYVYVLLIGLSEGIGTWWLPYLYVWTILWGMVMLLPKKMPKWLAPIVYALVCGLHGFGFGFCSCLGFQFGFFFGGFASGFTGGKFFSCLAVGTGF